MNKRSTEIINYFNDLEEVKRIKELEGYIDNNKEINSCFKDLKLKQQQLVNAKEYNQPNQYKIYLAEYNEIKKKLFDLPFVEEYFELLEYINSLLNQLTNEIEYKLNKIINN